MKNSQTHYTQEYADSIDIFCASYTIKNSLIVELITDEPSMFAVLLNAAIDEVDVFKHDGARSNIAQADIRI